MGARGSKTVQDSQSLAKQHDQTWIANDTTAFSAATRSGVISVTSKGKKNKDMVGGLRIKAPGKSRESGQQPVEEPLPRPRQKQVQIREQQKPPHEDDDEDESKYILSKERRQRKLTDFYWVPEKEVARGHYGVVKIGKGRLDGEQYAIKSIVKKKASYLPLIRNEIAILEKLQHPNIIRLVDAFEEGNTVHLVFEKCDGGELFNPIADANFAFSERQASRIVYKMLLAILYCHDRCLVHRDLKPENILLAEAGVDSEIKVIDFGLATSCVEGEILSHHVGTPYYIAPEVIDKRYNELCDLWSCGVITFTMMCSYPPFWDTTEKGIYNRIRRAQFAFEGPAWSQRTASVKDFIERLLTRNPQRRMTASMALNHPWIVYEGEATVKKDERRILTRLRKYCAYPYLKRLVMLIAAHYFIQKTRDLSRENELWAQFDTKGEGRIKLQSLIEFLLERRRLLTRPISQREIQSLLEALDIYNEKFVTFVEFIAWCVPRTVYLTSERLLQAFEILDVDGDGYISISDIEKFTMNLALGGPFTGIRKRYPAYKKQCHVESYRKYAEKIIESANLYEGPGDLSKLSIDDKPMILSTSVKECSAAASSPVWKATEKAPYLQKYAASAGTNQKLRWYHKLWKICGTKAVQTEEDKNIPAHIGKGLDFASFLRVVCGNEGDPF